MWGLYKVFIGFCRENKNILTIRHRKRILISGSSLKNQNINNRTRNTASTWMEKELPDSVGEMNITFVGLVSLIEYALYKLRNAKKVGPYLSSVLVSTILLGMIRLQKKV